MLEVGPGVSGLPSVREDPPGGGPLAALVTGAEALDVAPLLLLAVDLPFVSQALLALIAGWPGDGSVIPVVGGRPQHVSARYGRDAIEEARARYAAGESSLRWVRSLSGAVELDEESMGELLLDRSFADLDEPADLDRWGLRPADGSSAVEDSDVT